MKNPFKKSKPKQQYFIPNTKEPNLFFGNDENPNIGFFKCDCCGWSKLSLFYVNIKHQTWSNVHLDTIEEDITELWCKNCIKKYR